MEKLQQFAIGQRWLSDTETELGLGVLIDVDERSISILFPKSDETRVYARNNAPLSRIIFNVKDEVQDQEGLNEDEVMTIDSGKKAELGEKDWAPVRERLFSVDSHATPRVIVSVLMLREGFDVNNICVIVPLRSINILGIGGLKVLLSDEADVAANRCAGDHRRPRRGPGDSPSADQMLRRRREPARSDAP